MQSLTDDSVVIAAKSQVSCDLDGEAAVLNLATGIYYGLDKVGATIWQNIQTPATVATLRRIIMARYEVDAVTAQSDLLTFLDDMMHEGLAELLPGEASIS